MNNNSFTFRFQWNLLPVCLLTTAAIQSFSGGRVAAQTTPVLTSIVTVEVPYASVGARQLLIEQEGVDRLLSNDPTGASDKFHQLVTIDSSDVFSLNNLANAHMQLGDINKALANYNRAISLDNSKGFLYYNRAIAHTQANQLSDAVADYTRALQLNPQDAHSLANRGILRTRLANLPAALADYDAALKINSMLARATYNRAYTRRLAGDRLGAMVDYQLASKLLRNEGFVTEASIADGHITTLLEEVRTQ